jgi:hypothetical protein
MIPDPIAEPVRFVPAARGDYVLLGLHEHDRLRRHPVDARIHCVGGESRVVVFYFLRAYRRAEVGGHGVGTFGQNESWCGHS